ncbi:MAG: M28 family peptidase [Bacteroidetes bacterium]|nr:M28 family peptidase [Bacteroidota bacterium]
MAFHIRILVLFLTGTSVLNCFAQDSIYARKVIDALCGKKFNGRGYYKDGARKSAKYISKEMKYAGLKSISPGYFQEYKFPINRILSDPQLEINGIKFIPGREFLVGADAPNSNVNAVFGKFAKVVWIRASNVSDSQFQKSLNPHTLLNFRGNTQGLIYPMLYLIDTMPANLERANSKFLHWLRENANTITFHKDKITWSASPQQSKVVSFDVILPKSADKIYSGIESVKWNVKSSMAFTHQVNVVGMIPGTSHRDSFIMVTAHYDHLGRMGKSSMFPGANDNAAGVAMILDLAKYYEKHPPKYSMVFIAFSGEEAGLIGSGFYSRNPLHPLMKTRFMLNCDLVGTGETGITVVNGAVFQKEFRILDSINNANRYLTKIDRRGKAANSDHYHFSELGIPAFFWYQGGPRTSYHDIWDVPETLSLYGYNNTIKLAVEFFTALGN